MNFEFNDFLLHLVNPGFQTGNIQLYLLVYLSVFKMISFSFRHNFLY